MAAATAAQARTTLAELDNAERQARTAGHVNVAETVAEAVVRYTDEQGQADDGDTLPMPGPKPSPANSKPSTPSAWPGDTPARRPRTTRRHLGYHQSARQQRRTLARPPRLIELATVDADEGVELDVAGARLAKLLDQQVDHAESQLVAEEVSAAEDRRVSWPSPDPFPAPPLEIEYAVQALTAAAPQPSAACSSCATPSPRTATPR